ncbi:MAG TPA: hypothetical protein VH723_04915 [Candidatus Limnocylindrales bacterium]|jgi:hypothetical protein
MTRHRRQWTTVASVLLGAVVTVAACAGPAPATPAPSATPAGPPTPVPPPVAILAIARGQAIAGDLGTWIVQDHGEDSPWLPGEPIEVPAQGAIGHVLLDEPWPVDAWTAYVLPKGTPPRTEGLRKLATGSGVVQFELPPGAWSLQVSVWFAEGVGEASYYWELVPGS